MLLLNEGLIADVGDGKGTTYFGQTDPWLKEWDLPTPATAEQAIVNYEIWLYKSGLQVVCDEDVALAMLVIDYAVHSGLRRAVIALQGSLGVNPDGVIGPKTK